MYLGVGKWRHSQIHSRSCVTVSYSNTTRATTNSKCCQNASIYTYLSPLSKVSTQMHASSFASLHFLLVSRLVISNETCFAQPSTFSLYSFAPQSYSIHFRHAVLPPVILVVVRLDARHPWTWPVDIHHHLSLPRVDLCAQNHVGYFDHCATNDCSFYCSKSRKIVHFS